MARDMAVRSDSAQRSLAVEPPAEAEAPPVLPETSGWPELPPALDRVMRLNLADDARYLPPPGDRVVEYARIALRHTLGILEPAHPSRIEEWMDRVQVAVAVPPDDGDSRMRVASIHALSGDLPAVCWTVETWRAFLRRGPEARFWPGAPEVDGFLRPIGDAFRAKLAALGRIASVGRILPPPRVPTRDELERQAWQAKTDAERVAVIDAIRAKHGFGPSGLGRQETPVFQKTDVPVNQPPPRPPRYPSPEQLRDMREASRRKHGLPPLDAALPPGRKTP